MLSASGFGVAIPIRDAFTVSLGLYYIIIYNIYCPVTPSGKTHGSRCNRLGAPPGVERTYSREFYRSTRSPVFTAFGRGCSHVPCPSGYIYVYHCAMG